MNCPHCDHPHSRVIETLRVAQGLRRTRACGECRLRFYTLERVEEWDATVRDYVEAKPAKKVTPIQKEPKAPRIERFAAAVTDPLMRAITEEARELLVEWWNVSRRSKHKDKATWTKSAWESSLRRMTLLPAHKQVQLARAGVENGWQALKIDYLREDVHAPTAAGRPMPKDPAMLAALDQWPDQID